jgi:tryptophanyl-tRNA synthetase
LGAAVVEHLTPIQARYAEIMADKPALMAVLAKGAEEANEVADQTLVEVRKAMGFLAL